MTPTSASTAPSSPASDAGDISGDEVSAAPAARPLQTVKRRDVLFVAAFALLLYIPFLGSYGLWDPWETHYGEVARRMLEEHDWVKTRWQNEDFRSKPILTFWLMAAGMKTMGLADDGGYSGEMATSWKTAWALRLPFALFGVGGIIVLWYALARLYSKRAAWLAAVILASCPYYSMISRQAITDMPSAAMLVASMALFLLAIFDDRPLTPIWKRFNINHIFLISFALVVVPQLIYFTGNLEKTRLFIGAKAWISGPWVMLPFAVGFLAVGAWAFLTTKTTRQVYLYWFYLLNGVAVLAKGPVAPALAGLTIIGYLAVTREWKLLLKFEIPRGVLIALVVCLPWHFAMFLRDGMGWISEYVQQHLLGRAFRGVHGDRGTFDYFLGQLGVGMWPWICLVPGALVAAAMAPRPRAREEKLRVFFAAWGIIAFAFFTFVQTKFHHYILPAVPGFAVLLAFWFDDVWEGRAQGVRVALVVGLALFVATSIDLVSKQERLVHLFIYRYDRPWPYAPPWNVDYSGWLFMFALAFGALLLLLFVPRWRQRLTLGLMGVGALFAVFCVDVLLVGASPHWGQGELHRKYYRGREIHGVDLYYYGGEKLRDDWASGKDLAVKSAIPVTMKVGDEMLVRWQLRNAQEGVQEKGELRGRVSAIHGDDDEFTIEVSAEERAKIAALVEKNRSADDGKRRFAYVNADRMLAWQLNWRGENFYAGGEIWNPRDPDMQTVFMDTDNTKFLNYLKPRIGQGRKFWVVTEIGRLANLRTILPTQVAKETVEEPDKTNNKFGLAKFTLDHGTPGATAPTPPIAPEVPGRPAAPAPEPGMDPTP